MIAGRIFDTSAIVDFAGNRTRYTAAVVWSSVDVGTVIAVPTAAYVAALAQIPKEAHDIAGVLWQLPVTVRVDLTLDIAPGVADVLRPAGAVSPHGVTVASVVHAAKTRGWRILTAEPLPIRSLWPEADLELIP